MSTFDIIIPAHHEARTIAFVVRAAKERVAAAAVPIRPCRRCTLA